MIFGVTMGDANGVGPEILLKAFREGQLRPKIVVFGDLAILDYCNRSLNYNVPLRKAEGLSECKEGFLNVCDAGILRAEDLSIGRVDRRAGAAAREYVVAAARATMKGEIAAMVTLPVNKEATQLSDPTFTGHTELIGSLCGVEDVTIMLVSEKLIVTHVSTHVSLRAAIERVKKERICKIIELTCGAVGKLKRDAGIAVAGLNPHAGENGLFGREEIEEIRPAVEWAKKEGFPVEGPFPPDTVFHLAVGKKRFDAVICMYHDQGHIPLKLLDFDGGVNVTLGLPIIRTSVDHGTAFDIAYQGVASTTSLVKALEVAEKLARAG